MIEVQTGRKISVRDCTLNTEVHDVQANEQAREIEFHGHFISHRRCSDNFEGCVRFINGVKAEFAGGEITLDGKLYVFECSRIDFENPIVIRVRPEKRPPWPEQFNWTCGTNSENRAFFPVETT
ncbi:MAG: hypothetical protein WCP15_02645 [bacterium]